MKREIYLSAFGIHKGGGVVLLKALLPHLVDKLSRAALDARFNTEIAEALAGKIRWVPKSFIARWRSLNNLARCCNEEDVLFCFNSLPPTVKCSGRVIVYVHAPHFVGLHSGIRYEYKSHLRFVIERLWFKIGSRNVNEYWVQTKSMELAIKSVLPNATIRIMPFIDESLEKMLTMNTEVVGKKKSTAGAFFYPADGVGHKNHRLLLEAWEYLANKHGDSCPKLYLTLDKALYDRYCHLAGINVADQFVVNLGPLTRMDVLQRLQMSSALVFPSKAETFGLPLIEATATGTPILASERDFSRDVCNPSQTFDPDSALSIARAVERHIGISDVLPPCFSASEVADEIIKCSASHENYLNKRSV